MNFKKSLVFLFALVFTLTCVLGSFNPAAEAAAKKKIGITQFESNFTVALRGGGHYDIGTGAADMLTNELVKNKNYEVIERQQLAEVLKEQRLGATGAVDDATAAQMGKLIGLNYIVYGKVISAGAEKNDKSTGLGKWAVAKEELEVKVVIAVRMIDATTGAVVMSHTATGKITKKSSGIAGEIKGKDFSNSKSVQVTAEIYDQAVIQAIKQIASKINALNPLEGTVAQASGRTVYLDIGTEQGVEPGNRFQIYREGNPITNASGQIIGVTKTNIATVKVVSVEGMMSTCQVESDKNDKDKRIVIINQGDKARLL